MIGDLIIKVDTDITNFGRGMQEVKSNLQAIDDKADNTVFSLKAMATSLNVVGMASVGLSSVVSGLSFISHIASTATVGVLNVATGVDAIGHAAFRASAAMKLIQLPLSGAIIAGNAAKAVLLNLSSVIIAPFRLAGHAVAFVAKGLWSLAKPLLSIAKFAFMVRMAMFDLKIMFQTVSTVMGMLSPKMRLLVVGLAAVGLAGRVCRPVFNALSIAVKAGTVAFLALRNPGAAARLMLLMASEAAMKVTVTMIKMTGAVFRATKTMALLGIKSTVAGLRLLARSAITASVALATNLVGALMSAASWAGILAAGVVGWGVKLHAETEAATSGFETMLKSTSAAKQVMQDLTKFAADTPFEMPELRDSSKQLLNAGVSTGNLINKMTMLGDIAAATGKPITDFARIYSKVGSTGRVELETLNQLAERGVPIYDALAKQLGVNRQEMLKMIRTGKVGFGDLDAALGSITTGTGVFAGGMLKLSGLTMGLFSTLKDSVSMAVEEIGKQFSNAFNLTGGLKSSITFVDNLKGSIASMEPAWSQHGASISGRGGRRPNCLGLTH